MKPVLTVKPQSIDRTVKQSGEKKPTIKLMEFGKKKLNGLPKVEKSIEDQARYYENEIRMINDLIQLRLLELGQDDLIVREYGQRLARVETRLIPINIELEKAEKAKKAAKKNE